MPCTHRILVDRRLVWVTGAGTVNAKDLMSVYRALAEDSAFSAHFDSLWDFAGVESTDLGGSNVRELATVPRLFAKGSRRAVVTRTDLGYALTRMFQQTAEREGEGLAIFRSLEEALEWIGAPES